MPAIDDTTRLFKDFDERVFEFEIYPKKYNDCYFFDELCMMVGFSQHVDINLWDNKLFKIFINKLKSDPNLQLEFNYSLEGTQDEIWKTKDSKIYLNIWDDPGHLLQYAYVDITPDIIKRLENIHTAIDEFYKFC